MTSVMRTRGPRLALANAAFMMATASTLGAQTLRGRVVDSTSGEPVTLSFVALMEEGRQMVVSTLGQADGTFSLTAPETGVYFVYVARPGYATVMDGTFELGDDGIVDVQIGLRPEPLALEPIVVEAEATPTPLERSGFYDRAAAGLGTFLLRDEIERRAPNRLTDALTTVPRFQVMSRPHLGLQAELNPEVRVLLGSEYCSPTLYVDGAAVVFGSRAGQRGQAVRPDDYADPAEVEAVEIYTRISDMPVGIDPIGGCGVLMIWTRMR